jgi:hypothetical protein
VTLVGFRAGRPDGAGGVRRGLGAHPRVQQLPRSRGDSPYQLTDGGRSFRGARRVCGSGRQVLDRSLWLPSERRTAKISAAICRVPPFASASPCCRLHRSRAPAA